MMDTPAPAPEIYRYRLADQAYEILRSRILGRDLLPGQKLSVPQLAAQMGLSRSPVREAVQRLVSEGLSVEQARRGAVVAGVDAIELAEIYEIRTVLEGLAAKRAAARTEPTLIADLTAILEEHAAAIETQNEADIINADIRFHGRIMDAAASAPLTRVLNPILGRVNLAMLAGDLRAWPKKAVLEHRQVLDAIAAGDGKRAREAAERHIEQVHERLHTRLRNQPAIERE